MFHTIKVVGFDGYPEKVSKTAAAVKNLAKDYGTITTITLDLPEDRDLIDEEYVQRLNVMRSEMHPFDLQVTWFWRDIIQVGEDRIFASKEIPVLPPPSGKFTVKSIQKVYDAQMMSVDSVSDAMEY